jgi:hypothetical protein
LTGGILRQKCRHDSRLILFMAGRRLNQVLDLTVRLAGSSALRKAVVTGNDPQKKPLFVSLQPALGDTSV